MTSPFDQQFQITLLCRGQLGDGEPYWAYLQIAPTKAKAFKQAQASGHLVLEDYGTIIEWGKGADVPSAIKERMERDHGVNHQFEDDAQNALKKET